MAGGLGIALLPDRTARHYGLVPVEMSAQLAADTDAWPEDDLFMVTHRTLRDVPRVRAVSNYLLEEAGGRLREGTA